MTGELNSQWHFGRHLPIAGDQGLISTQLMDEGLQDSVGGGGLACPICGRQSPNLAQLNRHLDDDHGEEVEAKDAIFSWFRTAQRRVAGAAQKTTSTLSSLSFDKLAQPLSNGQLDLNSNPGSSRSSDGRSSGVAVKTRTNSNVSTASTQSTESIVMRTHWQRETSNDTCSMNGCRKALGLMNGKHHCRKCGRLFCENHSAYQMRLSKDAHSDPENGIWCRVCQKCYIEREGYNDVNGVSRNRTQAFLRLRKQRLNVVNLEANKLERRLEKLSLLYAGGNTISNRVPLTNTVVPGSGRRAVEQAVVPWQEDHEVAACPLCAQTFSTLLNRRHHCRLCGRVICGKTSCNSSIAIHSEQEPGTAPTVPQIRVCLECKRIVTRRREAVQDLANVPRVIAMYPSVTRYRTLIDENLPKFNNLLMSMAARDTVECEDRDYQMATKLRQTLMDYFGEMDKLGKTIRSLSSSTPDTQRLQRNVSLAIFNYLQNHMFTLQMMPKVGTQGAPANGLSVNNASQIEALTQEIEIMEEQYSQVSTFLDDAIRRRRLEDAQALKESVDDLRVAIETKRKEVQALLT